jgi:hypothetical protein
MHPVYQREFLIARRRGDEKREGVRTFRIWFCIVQFSDIIDFSSEDFIRRIWLLASLDVMKWRRTSSNKPSVIYPSGLISWVGP